MKKYFKLNLNCYYIYNVLERLREFYYNDEEYQKRILSLIDYMLSKITVEHNGEIIDQYVVIEVEEDE